LPATNTHTSLFQALNGVEGNILKYLREELFAGFVLASGLRASRAIAPSSALKAALRLDRLPSPGQSLTTVTPLQLAHISPSNYCKHALSILFFYFRDARLKGLYNTGLLQYARRKTFFVVPKELTSEHGSECLYALPFSEDPYFPQQMLEAK
jgi:hypothetical protein